MAMLLHENPNPYIHHDQLFKQLIHTFFAEFLEAFFPAVYEHIDFSSIRALPEEMFTDLLEGESRRADIIIETKLKNEDTLIIIHVEPQSYAQPNFHERMFQYFCLLYSRERKPILPIAIFSYDQIRDEKNSFRMSFPFFHVLIFVFLILELRKMNWRFFLNTNNPVAAALLSKMGYTEKERVQVKKEFLRMLVKMKLDPARAELINGFFETYLSLTESEEEELMEEIKQLNPNEAEQIIELPNSWREKGREEGRIEGRKEGKFEAKIEDAREMLKEGLAVDLIAKITKLNLKEIEELKKTI
ncbi:RpnC/YadD family protein [Bacillus massilinigeriensis]|uniref:Rpn family recombination-promoting nuclease/putative transposase n=1 Tax=Bacillus massilionigeriensis TaxID=1805475 RepID=UPI00096B0E22|nr:Rpn family recombination-promoting nuclease/putative transposase [Bacillus massilionigeriensis]